MAENQNENEVNNTEELENHVVEESFVREDLKQVAATSSIFDSLKDLQDIPAPEDSQLDETPESSPKVYTGRKYRFYLNPNLQSFYDINPSNEHSTTVYSSNPITNHYVKTVNNGIGKGLGKKGKEERTIEVGTTIPVWQANYRKIFNRLIKNYPRENIAEVQEFFTRFTNALMFELSRNTKSDINAHARMKSQYSFLGKCFYRASAHNKKPINDLFGIKLVLDSTDDTLPVNHPLMKQKAENDQKIIQFQELVDTYLVDTDFISGLKTSSYYARFIDLLDSFGSVVPPEATEYLGFINEKKTFLQEKLTRLNALGLTDARMTEAELKLDDEFRIFYDPRKKYTSDFAAVLAKYKELNNDLVNYPILCSQVDNILKNSKLLSQFGFEILKEDYKNNSKGYQAKFIVIDTPVGGMEIQLQTDNQLREGITGFNAHDKFKSIPPLPIIPRRGETEKWNEFIDAVDFVSPFAFTVEEDTLATDELTMKTTYDSRHLSLKKVIQVAKDSPIYPVVNKYLTATYSLLSSGAKSQESLQRSDVIDYVHSNSFKKLLEEKEAKKKLGDDEQDDGNNGGPTSMPLGEGTAALYNMQNGARKNNSPDHDDR